MGRRLSALLLLRLLLFSPESGAGILDASWTAPTTNTDGSPLTDLGAYRVYYSPTSPPCPGASLFQVASATAAPAPNQTVRFTLSGLASSSPYNVAVTAVDLTGVESACSVVAQAVARRALPSAARRLKPSPSRTRPAAPSPEASRP